MSSGSTSARYTVQQTKTYHYMLFTTNFKLLGPHTFRLFLIE
jgi:hypothetical protein